MSHGRTQNGYIRRVPGASDAFSGKWKVGHCQAGTGQSAHKPEGGTHERPAEIIRSLKTKYVRLVLEVALSVQRREISHLFEEAENSRRHGLCVT